MDRSKSDDRPQKPGYRAFSLPGQFAPRSQLANKTRANSLPGLFAPCPFRSLELSRCVYVAIYFLSRKFPGHFALGSESSREVIGQSAVGQFAPGSEWARERKGCESKSASSWQTVLVRTCRCTTRPVLDLQRALGRPSDLDRGRVANHCRDIRWSLAIIIQIQIQDRSRKHVPVPTGPVQIRRPT